MHKITVREFHQDKWSKRVILTQRFDIPQLIAQRAKSRCSYLKFTEKCQRSVRRIAGYAWLFCKFARCKDATIAARYLGLYGRSTSSRDLVKGRLVTPGLLRDSNGSLLANQSLDSWSRGQELKKKLIHYRPVN